MYKNLNWVCLCFHRTWQVINQQFLKDETIPVLVFLSFQPASEFLFGSKLWWRKRILKHGVHHKQLQGNLEGWWLVYASQSFFMSLMADMSNYPLAIFRYPLFFGWHVDICQLLLLFCACGGSSCLFLLNQVVSLPDPWIDLTYTCLTNT